MPFQRADSAASTQLIHASTSGLGTPEIATFSPALVTKSALAESSSSKARHDPQAPTSASASAPVRKQHHVSFQDHPEHLEPPATVSASKRRGRNQRSSNSSSRPDTSDFRDRDSEHGSSKHSTSRASSRQSRRDQSEPESYRTAATDSAPSSSSRQRRPRQRSDKRSEHGAKTNLDDSAQPHSRMPPSSKSETFILPAKKDAKSNDQSASAKRNRQPSAQGILPDLRTHEASRSEAGTRSFYSSSSRRDRFPRSIDARSNPGDNLTSRDGRQLFDPRRDDPVKFASQQRSQLDDRDRSASAAPSPRLASTPNLQPQSVMRRDPSSTSNESHLGRSPIIKPTISGIPFTPALDPTDPAALQAYAAEIKTVYRSISTMEANLQQLHQAEVERARHNMADYTPPDLRDPSYWITLISKHRDLADGHSSFLEMTCKSELPHSIQELPEKYNLPSRLWQTGFHLMLESLRTSLSSQHHRQRSDRKAELLDHLTEFIYFAYSFYSALHESERYKVFRRAWIESLGDLSRYRMAVAGLAANMAIDAGGQDIRNKSSQGNAFSLPTEARIDDDDIDAEDEESLNYSQGEDNMQEDGKDDLNPHLSIKDDQGAGLTREGRQKGSRHGPAEAKEADAGNNMDKASIGSAALGDWDWTEKETWRQTAKDWYALGITEAPTVGRLHHHLGMLCRGENDLRAFYHLTKSLIAAKPFVSARDSILTLFDQERQARRLRRDSSIEDLFLYLHGVLITRVQLDDFEPVFDRLVARLTKLVEQQGPAGLPQSVWTMMAFINIAGLFQYGSDDSILAGLLLEQSGKSSKGSNRTERIKASTPAAILVSSAAAKTDDSFLSELPRDVEWEDPSEDESEAGEEVQVISLEAKTAIDEPEAAAELPGVLERAAKLCFSMQSLTFDLSSADASYRSNPYNTTISTFLLSLCQSKKAFRIFERFIPWDIWLKQVELSVSLTERKWPKVLSSTYITARLLLPEDLCLRGVLGLSRHIYERSLWRSPTSDGGVAGSQGFDNEVEVLDADDGELYTRTETAWRNAGASRREEHQITTSLDTIRAFRMAFVARKLAKAGRGFDLDSKTSVLSLSTLLIARLSRHKLEEEQRKLESRLDQFRLRSHAADAVSELGGHGDSRQDSCESDEFDSDWDTDRETTRHERVRSAEAALTRIDSVDQPDEIRALHARSCYLRDVLQNVGRTRALQRSESSTAGKGQAHGSDRQKSGAAQPSALDGIIPAYTILVVDTNIILTPGDLIVQLIESQRWTIIVPLAVITELDGLRRNENDLGKEAERAIQFLESHIRSHAKCVKVQTSRGNYLSDLSCRSEEIDFTWQGSGSSGSTTTGGTQPVLEASLQLDAAGTSETKSPAARNVDEVILRILAWQRDNFIDRRAMLRSSTNNNAASASNKSKQESPPSQSTRPDTARGSLPQVTSSAHKSVLLTLDRNLRLKAKSRGLASLDLQGAASLLELAPRQKAS